MHTENGNRLSTLDRACLMKYFLADLSLFKKHSNAYVNALGIEGTFETIEEIAEQEPNFIKIVSHDINNFVILLDENCEGRHTPIFIMRDGVEQELDQEDDD